MATNITDALVQVSNGFSKIHCQNRCVHFVVVLLYSYRMLQGTARVLRGEDQLGIESKGSHFATPAASLNTEWQSSDLSQVYQKFPCVAVNNEAGACALTNACIGETRQVMVQASKMKGAYIRLTSLSNVRS